MKILFWNVGKDLLIKSKHEMVQLDFFFDMIRNYKISIFGNNFS